MAVSAGVFAANDATVEQLAAVLIAAGHSVIVRETVDDTDAARYLADWVADAEIELVVTIANSSTRAALSPLITRPLLGVGDMPDTDAGHCETTLVLLVPNPGELDEILPLLTLELGPRPAKTAPAKVRIPTAKPVAPSAAKHPRPKIRESSPPKVKIEIPPSAPKPQAAKAPPSFHTKTPPPPPPRLKTAPPVNVSSVALGIDDLEELAPDDAAASMTASVDDLDDVTELAEDAANSLRMTPIASNPKTGTPPMGMPVTRPPPAPRPPPPPTKIKTQPMGVPITKPAEPAKLEPPKVGVAKAAAVVQVSKLEPSRVEPAKLEPVKVAKVEAAKVDAGKVDAAKVDAANGEPAKPIAPAVPMPVVAEVSIFETTGAESPTIARLPTMPSSRKPLVVLAAIGAIALLAFIGFKITRPPSRSSRPDTAQARAVEGVDPSSDEPSSDQPSSDDSNGATTTEAQPASSTSTATSAPTTTTTKPTTTAAATDPSALPASSTPTTNPTKPTTTTTATTKPTATKPTTTTTTTKPTATATTTTTKPSTTKPSTTKPTTATPSTPMATTEPGCDQATCVLDNFAKACCARYKPRAAGAVPYELERSAIPGGMSRVKAAVIKCGETITAKGIVKVAITVGGDGRVKDISVSETPDAVLGECVAAAARKATFPASQEGGAFSYPFKF